MRKFSTVPEDVLLLDDDCKLGMITLNVIQCVWGGGVVCGCVHFLGFLYKGVIKGYVLYKSDACEKFHIHIDCLG